MPATRSGRRAVLGTAAPVRHVVLLARLVRGSVGRWTRRCGTQWRARRRAVEGEKRLRAEKHAAERAKDARREELFAARDERLQRFLATKLEAFHERDVLGSRSPTPGGGSVTTPEALTEVSPGLTGSSSTPPPATMRWPPRVSPGSLSSPEDARCGAASKLRSPEVAVRRATELCSPLSDVLVDGCVRLTHQQAAEASERDCGSPSPEPELPSRAEAVLQEGYVRLTERQAEAYDLARYLPRRAPSPAEWLA